MLTKQQFLNLFRQFERMDERTVLKLLADTPYDGSNIDALVAALYEAGYSIPSRQEVLRYIEERQRNQTPKLLFCDAPDTARFTYRGKRYEFRCQDCYDNANVVTLLDDEDTMLLIGGWLEVTPPIPTTIALTGTCSGRTTPAFPLDL